MARVVKRRKAEQDLDEHAAYLQEMAGPRVAIRFLRAAKGAFELLASMPTFGSRWQVDLPGLSELRFFRIKRFPKYVVFYRPVRGGIAVIRVLHSAQDIDRILAEEPAGPS